MSFHLNVLTPRQQWRFWEGYPDTNTFQLVCVAAYLHDRRATTLSVPGYAVLSYLLCALKQFQSDCKSQLTRDGFYFITLKNNENLSLSLSKGRTMSSCLICKHSSHFLLLKSFAPLNCSEMQKPPNIYSLLDAPLVLLTPGALGPVMVPGPVGDKCTSFAWNRPSSWKLLASGRG